MRKLSLSLIVAFAVYVTAAVAQAGNMGGSTGSQGTQGSSPSTQPGAQTQPGQPGGPDIGPNTGAPSDQTGAANNNMGDHSQGEKKLKGCIQSQGGQYVLESKHGKSVMLSGQDLAAHVGHEVKVKGTWESGNASGMSSTSTTSAGGNSAGEKTFNVTNVEMVSDTCKGSSKNSSSTGMGAGSTGSATGTGSNDNTGGSGSTGTGTGTGNTGSSTGTGSGNGSSTTPPQQ